MITKYSHADMAQVWSENNKLDKWLLVEIAACEAWSELGAVPKEALPKIRAAKYDLDRIAVLEAQTQHDVTAFLGSVAESIGDEARYIHLGLTSSDVIDTGLALQVREATDILSHDIKALLEVIGAQAVKHRLTVMPGRTHGIHAEPITFGFKMLVWLDEMKRNLSRLTIAGEDLKVGKISGAVGTHATIPPQVEEIVCQKLSLRPAPVSTQTIQRDRHAHYVSVLAVIASSLEKIATEIRGLQRTEVSEVEEPFGAGQHGSSAMPHKRNPVLSERVCGIARVIRGHAITAMENVALWHERDISHSSAERIIFPDACGLLDYVLRLTARIITGLDVHPDRMLENLASSQGVVFSQRVLLALVERGLPRESAYRIVQRDAMKAKGERASFRDTLAGDPEVATIISGKDLDEIFDYNHYLKFVDVAFERLGLATGNRATKPTEAR